jgi:hypothetical protein
MPASQDEFAQLVMDGLRRAGVGGEVSYDADQFQVTVEGKIESILFLTNSCDCDEESLVLRGRVPNEFCKRLAETTVMGISGMVRADWGGWSTGCGTGAGPTWPPATEACYRRASNGSCGTPGPWRN